MQLEGQGTFSPFNAHLNANQVLFFSTVAAVGDDSYILTVTEMCSFFSASSLELIFSAVATKAVPVTGAAVAVGQTGLFTVDISDVTKLNTVRKLPLARRPSPPLQLTITPETANTAPLTMTITKFDTGIDCQLTQKYTCSAPSSAKNPCSILVLHFLLCFCLTLADYPRLQLREREISYPRDPQQCLEFSEIRHRTDLSCPSRSNCSDRAWVQEHQLFRGQGLPLHRQHVCCHALGMMHDFFLSLMFFQKFYDVVVTPGTAFDGTAYVSWGAQPGCVPPLYLVSLCFSQCYPQLRDQVVYLRVRQCVQGHMGVLHRRHHVLGAPLPSLPLH